MMLIIANKSFTGNLNKQKFKAILAALEKIPNIIIRSSNNIETEQQLIVMQREYAYVDRTDIANTIRYVGTKRLESCIFLLLYNDVECFAVHVDQSRKLDLSVCYDSFHDVTNLRAKLIGGNLTELSRNNIYEIFEQLLLFARQHRITITVDSQCLLKRNRFTNNDRYQFVFDKIMERANHLFLSLFQEPIDMEKLAQYNVAHLSSRNVAGNSKFLDFAKLLRNIYVLNPKKNETLIAKLVKILSLTSQKKAYEALELMFSRQGFNFFDSLYQKHDIYSDAKLRNFVVDLETGNIISLSKMTPTPHEIYRDAKCMDIFCKLNYLPCYDSERRSYQTHALSRNFVVTCRDLKASLQLQHVVFEEFQLQLTCSFFKLNYNFTNVNRLGVLLKCGAYESKPIQLNKRLPDEYPFDKKAINEFYMDNEDIETQSLIAIRNAFDTYFHARIRRQPAFLIDALMKFKSVKEAEEFIESKLIQHNLIAHVVKFRDEDVYVCIPAINMRKNAERINLLKNLTKKCYLTY